MNVFETAFWALKALKKKPAETKPAAPAEESQTEFFSRTADLTPATPHWNKGLILERRGDKAGAIQAYRDAVRAVPFYYDAHANLTRLLCETEQWEKAIQHGEMAVRLKRNSPKVHNNLSVAFYNQGDVAKAIHHSALALQFAPDDPDLVENLTQIRSAHPELEKHSSAGAARQIWMQVAECHYEAGFAHLQERRVAEGIAKWRLTIKLAPAWADPYCNLAALLAAHPDDSVRNPKEALQLAQKAMQLGDSSPRFYDALAAAYASTGRFREAKQVLEEILPTLRVKGPLESVEKLSEHHRLYTQGKPLRQELPLFRISANKA